jgi:hypothetical protein
MAVRQRIGLVVVPWVYTDPAYGCYPPQLLSAAGGKPARGLLIEDALEMIRGAFVLHTRGYNAVKPLNKVDTCWAAFRLIKVTRFICLCLMMTLTVPTPLDHIPHPLDHTRSGLWVRQAVRAGRAAIQTQ